MVSLAVLVAIILVLRGLNSEYIEESKNSLQKNQASYMYFHSTQYFDKIILENGTRLTRTVVVDGSNIAYNQTSIPSLKYIKQLRYYLKKHHVRPIIFVDSSLKHKLGKVSVQEKNELLRLISTGKIKETPTGSYADKYIPDYAVAKNIRFHYKR